MHALIVIQVCSVSCTQTDMALIRLTIAFVTALKEIIYITQVVQGLVSLSVSCTQADMVTRQTWSPGSHGHHQTH